MEVERDHRRAFTLHVEGRALQTPAFFPAVSSCCPQIPIERSISILRSIRYPRLLLSAYDIAHASSKGRRAQLIATIGAMSRAGSLIALDSGNYEARCHDDRSWKIKNLERVLKTVEADICFAFDPYPSAQMTSGAYVQASLTHLLRTAANQRRGLTVPILHSTPSNIPALIGRLAKVANPQIVAVAERNLGADLSTRCDAVSRIRRVLDRTTGAILLHVLGVSNPLAIAAYALNGADLFDGLEWSRSLIHPVTGVSLDMSFVPLLDCDCRACTGHLKPVDRAATHNLYFYTAFMNELREAIMNEGSKDLLSRYSQGVTLDALNRLVVKQ